MPSFTFFVGLGSRSSSLASKTGTPAWSLRKATRSLRSLMTVPPISRASLPPPTGDDLGRLVGPGQQRRHADLGDRRERADGGLDRQVEVVLRARRHSSRAISNRRASTQT